MERTSAIGSILRAVSAGLLIAVPSYGHAQGKPAEVAPPEVRTEATGQRSVRPDLARVTLEFSAVGATPREAGSRVAARADSLRRALQTLGIPRDSLRTGSRWYWWGSRIEVILGHLRYTPPPPGTSGPGFSEQDTAYRAHDVIEVRIRDLTKVGAVVDAALDLRITKITNIQFSATNTEDARQEALREASTKARRQAATIAEASGARLGRILSLSTQASLSDRWDLELATQSVRGSGSGGTPTEVLEPHIPVVVTVHGRWELVAKP